MKIDKFGRINREDFEEEYKPLVDKLATLLNSQIENITNAFSKNIDFDNLKQEIKDLTVSVDVNGTPRTLTNFKNNLNTRVIGINVIRAECLSDNTLVPVSHPFLTYSESGRIVNISNISGLQTDETYKLTINTIV